MTLILVTGSNVGHQDCKVRVYAQERDGIGTSWYVIARFTKYLLFLEVPKYARC